MNTFEYFKFMLVCLIVIWMNFGSLDEADCTLVKIETQVETPLCGDEICMTNDTAVQYRHNVTYHCQIQKKSGTAFMEYSFPIVTDEFYSEIPENMQNGFKTYMVTPQMSRFCALGAGDFILALTTIYSVAKFVIKFIESLINKYKTPQTSETPPNDDAGRPHQD